MEAVILLIVFIMAFVVFVVGVVVHIVGEVYKWYKSTRKKHQIASTERAILKATGNADITRLVMLLREDLNYRSHAQEKLQRIAANPKLAMVAFQTALRSKDAKMQKVGIKGLVYLNCAKAIVPLLEVHKNSSTVKSEALEALIELAKIAPVKGQGGFLRIFQQLGQTPTYEYGLSLTLRTKIDYIVRLLRIAIQRRADFSAKEYDSLFGWAIHYSDHLALSKNIQTRHAGEDFRKTIERVRGQEQWRQEQWRREQQRQERQRQATKDYYKILQVDPSAEQEVIAGAYRRLAAKYHPDVYKGQDATPKMQLINKAYAVLSDPVKRKNYDELRARQVW